MVEREIQMMPPRPSGMWHDPEQRRLLRRVIPAAIGVHLGVFALLAADFARAPEGPRVTSYAVDIAFPPPELLGMPEAAARGERDAAAEKPAEESAPLPATAVERKAPERVKEEKAEAEALRLAEKEKAEREAEAKRAADQRKTEAALAAKAREKGAGSTGGAAKAASGPTPSKAAVQGEGLNVHTAGAEFVDPAYLRNIIIQINRHFRRPSAASAEEAEVRFWITRGGKVAEIEVVKSSSSFAFRAAAMEAVEQAGRRGLFGPLPSAYPGEKLLVSFYFRPAS